jgi:hypothetical protein
MAIIKPGKRFSVFKFALFTIVTFSLVAGSVAAWRTYQYVQAIQKDKTAAHTRVSELSAQLTEAQRQYEDLANTDQVKRTKELEAEVKQLHDLLTQAVALYDRLADLRDGKGKHNPLDVVFALVLNSIANQQLSTTQTTLKDLQAKIATEEAKAAASTLSASALAALPATNAAPGSGYKRQKVHIDGGDFVVDIIAADMGSAKVIVDTASDSTCGNNCPVLPLQTFVQRSNAFAGINGIYFCPDSYPSCAGKTNSFDQLVMNKNKVYFNSDNNVYSQNPVAIFGPGSSVRFMAHAQDWGRDSSPDAVVSNHPPLLLGSQVLATTTDPKLTSRGYRGFLSHKGSTAYMGFVHAATTAEAATVLKAMGMEDALNLDSGGSTALWAGGYKLGPGRALPMAILFVRR